MALPCTLHGLKFENRTDVSVLNLGIHSYILSVTVRRERNVL